MTTTSQVVFPRSIIYQQKAEPLPVPVVAVATFLSVVQFTGLFQYQAKAEPVLVEPPQVVIVPLATNTNVTFKRVLQYQIKSEPISVTGAAPVVTVVEPTTITSEVSFDRSFFYQDITGPVATISRVEAVATTTLTSGVSFERSFFYQDLAWSPATVPRVEAVATTTTTSEVVFSRSFLYQDLAWTPRTIAPAVFTPIPYIEGDTGLTFQKTIVYQQSTEADSPDPPRVEAVATTTLTSGVSFERSFFYQDLAWPPTIIPRVEATLTTTTTSQVSFKRSIIYQSLAWCPRTITTAPSSFTTTTAVIFPYSTTAYQQAHFAPEATIPRVEAVEPTTIASEVIFQRSFFYQDLAWTPRTITPEVTTEDKWHQPWSQPVRFRRLATAQQKAYFAPEATIPSTFSLFTTTTSVSFQRSFFYQDLALVPVIVPRVEAIEPTTITSEVCFSRSFLYQDLAWTPQTIVPPVFTPIPYVEGDTGLTFQKTIIYQVLAEAESPESNIFWYRPLEEPVRLKRGLGAHLQQEPAWSTLTPPPTAIASTTTTSQVSFPRSFFYQDLAWAPYPITPEILTEDKWHYQWSLPVRLKSGLRADQQQFISWVPLPPEVITEDKWHYQWSLPVRQKPGLRANQQQSLVWDPRPIIPEIITEDKWHQPWSIPVKLNKKGLSAQFQQSFTFDQNKPPAAPVFVILDATETNNDVAQIFAVVYSSQTVRCYVSIKEVSGSDPTYASIEETD